MVYLNKESCWHCEARHKEPEVEEADLEDCLSARGSEVLGWVEWSALVADDRGYFSYLLDCSQHA